MKGDVGIKKRQAVKIRQALCKRKGGNKSETRGRFQSDGKISGKECTVRNTQGHKRNFLFACQKNNGEPWRSKRTPGNLNRVSREKKKASAHVMVPAMRGRNLV